MVWWRAGAVGVIHPVHDLHIFLISVRLGGQYAPWTALLLLNAALLAAVQNTRILACV